MPNPRTITLEELEQFFNVPEKQVAKNLGVCLTSLKKLCRHHGIHRWPYRKLKSIEKKIHRIRQNSSSSFDDQSAAQTKLMVLVEERQRFPFMGQPSGSYGGRRSNSSSSRSPDCDRQQPSKAESLMTPSACYSSSISASDMIPGVCTSPHQLMLEQHYQQQALQLQEQQQQEQLIFDAFSAYESGSSDFSSCEEDMVGQPDDAYESSIVYAPIHSQASVAESYYFQQEFAPASADTFSSGYSSYFDSFAPFEHHFSSDVIATC